MVFENMWKLLQERIKSLVVRWKLRKTNQMLELWIRKGRALNNNGKHQEAIECYDAVLRINPCHHQVWSFKGNALLKLERLQEAKDAFAHFVRFAPSESQYISQAKELMHSIEDTIKMEKRPVGGSGRRVVKKQEKGMSNRKG
jgi:tetratricopeptide (TPR) repeat protein